MRLRWVGDSRDYVKWDCVLENAKGRFVFYVPMLRRSVDPECKHSEVQMHFDQRKDLKQFAELFRGDFSVLEFQDREYSKRDAEGYFRLVIEELRRLQRSHHVLVFIDPDTGIEPESGAKNEHLRNEDLRSVWKALNSGDKLIVYQHASRTPGWKERHLNRAAEILETEFAPDKHLYSDETLAKDVCFLVLEKPKS